MTDLENILYARENRAIIKKRLLQDSEFLVSLSLNVPGIPKLTDELSEFFKLVRMQLLDWLLANRILVNMVNEASISDFAGDYYLIPINNNYTNGFKIKEITEKFEQNHKLGRFIDVDVYHAETVFNSGKSKVCFYCGKYSAVDCRRNNRHTLPELREYQQKKITAYLKKEKQKQAMNRISELALKAVLFEISLTPKPGLVDRMDNGVHRDMDYKLFLDSTSAISVYFKSLVKAGLSFNGSDFSSALPIIRNIGLKMEQAMFRQTNGVNTQKGLIFLMGIALFSAGFVVKTNQTFETEAFRMAVKKICTHIVDNELKNNLSELTHGAKCFEKYKSAGARFEAQMGFPTVFNVGLPQLLKSDSLDEGTLIITLLSIMAYLDDTNVLYRSNPETLNALKEMCIKAVNDYSVENYHEIIEFCTKRNISPGGSADLLSVTVFMYLLIKNFV